MEPASELSQAQKVHLVGEQRALSLSRSRSRGRSNPSELLARKQQLLGQAQLQADEWDEEEKGATFGDGGAQHRRSLVRRAKQFERNQQQLGQRTDQAEESRAKSVEAKLESLSEMLKSHQLGLAESSKQEAASTSGATSLAQSAQAAKSIDDVYILLAKKEKDLQLAAELGKVLLEKNDELSKANERITEDYSHKLEVSKVFHCLPRRGFAI